VDTAPDPCRERAAAVPVNVHLTPIYSRTHIAAILGTVQ
jgi:hypothetical protein